MRPALTLPQAAEALAINYHTAREWVLTGRLKAFRPGRHWKVDQAEIERIKRATTYRPGCPVAPGPNAPSPTPIWQADCDTAEPEWEIPLPSDIRRRGGR